MTWLDDLAAFCAQRCATAGRAALAAEIERDMHVLERSLARARTPLARLLSEVGVKGFILSAEIGPHRHLRRETDARHALLFAPPGGAAPPIVALAGLAGLDPDETARSARTERRLARIRAEGLEAEIAPAAGGGISLCLSWPANALEPALASR